MRLIDADVFDAIINDDGTIDEYATETARNAMLIMPTVDAVPVRHGKWIKGSETKRVKENRYGVLFDAYYCSACESEAYWDSDYGQILFHYCPNCGARMDEDEAD